MKWTRRILIALVILAGLITALWWEENWRGQKIWEESCARLRAAGEPVEIEDIIPPMIPDEENVAAAPIFAEIFTDEQGARLSDHSLRSGYTPEGAADRVPYPSPRALGSLHDDTLLREWNEYVQGCLPARAPVPEGLSLPDELLFILRPHDSAWCEISDAVRRPKCRWPLDYDNYLAMKSPHLDGISNIMVGARPRLIAYAGKNDAEAWTHGMITLLCLGRHYSESSTSLISYMIGFVHEAMILQLWQHTLGTVKLSGSQLVELQEQVSRISLESTQRSLRHQRVTTLSELRRLNVDHVAGIVAGSWAAMLGGNSDWKSRLHATLILSRPNGWQIGEAAAFQDSSYKLIQAVSVHNNKAVQASIIKQMRVMANRMEEHPRALSLDAILASSHDVSAMIVEKACRRLALARCAEVWCAIERHRLKHGTIPGKLEDLRPAFLSELPLDPVNGGSLRYMKRGEGAYVVYSIGWNEMDDGGRAGKKRQDLDWVWASDPFELEEEPTNAGPTSTGD